MEEKRIKITRIKASLGEVERLLKEDTFFTGGHKKAMIAQEYFRSPSELTQKAKDAIRSVMKQAEVAFSFSHSLRPDEVEMILFHVRKTTEQNELILAA